MNIPLQLIANLDPSVLPPGPPGPAGPPGPSGGFHPQVLSGSKELITSLPLTNGATVSMWSPYTVTVPALRSADIVLLTSRFEVTNPYGFAVGIGRFLARWPSQGASSSGYINPPVMDNVGSERHHLTDQLTAFDTGQSGDITYALTLYAVSTAAQAGNTITVEQGYGGISALILRAPS